MCFFCAHGNSHGHAHAYSHGHARDYVHGHVYYWQTRPLPWLGFYESSLKREIVVRLTERVEMNPVLLFLIPSLLIDHLCFLGEQMGCLDQPPRQHCIQVNTETQITEIQNIESQKYKTH